MPDDRTPPRDWSEALDAVVAPRDGAIRPDSSDSGDTARARPTYTRPSRPARAYLDDDGAPARPPSKPRRGAKKKHWGLRVTLIVVLAVALSIVGTGAYIWFDLNGKLNSHDVDDMLGSNRPPTSDVTHTMRAPGDPFAGHPVNILVMGTDSRDGANTQVSGDNPGGMRSDTTFVLHVSADRSRVYAVSIPRDTWITIPDCETESGKIIPEAGWRHMGFNAAFAYGVDSGGSIAAGAACTIRAVEAIAKLRIDAYVVIDFMGFVNVVDAIGGVDVTLQCAISSKSAGGLELPAGVVHLDGMTAVNLARARTGTGLGDGSDLRRIDRQHALFNAIADKVYSMNYVTDFPQLYNLVGAVISSLTTDVGTNLAQIAGFAYSLKGLDVSDITFVTIPVAEAGNGVNVVFLPGQDEPIWKALRDDKPLPGHEPTTPSQTPTDSPTDSPTDTASTAGPGVDISSTPTGPPPPISIQKPSDCA